MKWLSLFAFILLSCAVFAQPANDDCVNAVEIIVGEDEANAIRVAGDTRGATASTTPQSVCSSSWYTDDVWFQLTTPVDIPEPGIVIKAYFDTAVTATDVLAIGMAIYASCDSLADPIRCFSSDAPAGNSIFISAACMRANQNLWIRIWSAGADKKTEGTFSIAAFNAVSDKEILWEETFGDSLDGWTTYGTCEDPDSNANAVWQYLPDGLLDKGTWIYAGFGIQSASRCDGAVGVDSDYNTGLGTQESYGGPCENPATYILESPGIFSGDWITNSISVSWTQAIRQFQSEYYVSYRAWDVDTGWTPWNDIEINTEFEINGNALSNDRQIHFLPEAAGHDSLQLRFTYNANYYMWGIDDIQLIGDGYFYDLGVVYRPAIMPWVEIPYNQVFPFYVLSGIYNKGSETQYHVKHSVTLTDLDNADTLSSQTLIFDTIPGNSLETTTLFPDPIVIPSCERVTLSWQVDGDPRDFSPWDNQAAFEAGTCSPYFQLEDGFTRSVAVSALLYEAGAPRSYTYGTIFRPVVTTPALGIQWGVNNPSDLVGSKISINLVEWMDANDDLIAQYSERKIIASEEYIFTGNEDDNAIIDTYLHETSYPNGLAIMEGGKFYMAMVEYKAENGSQPVFYMLANSTRDYSHIVTSMDTAYNRGLTDHRLFMTALGFRADGNIDSIDYEVRELDPTDNRIYFGADIVPLVRIIQTGIEDVHDVSASSSFFNISPNPASQYLNITLSESHSQHKVDIQFTDICGKCFFKTSASSIPYGHVEKIDVSHFPSGVYMITVTADQLQHTIPVTIIN